MCVLAICFSVVNNLIPDLFWLVCTVKTAKHLSLWLTEVITYVPVAASLSIPKYCWLVAVVRTEL